MGIIGIVAALTIPTLINDYQQRVLKEQTRNFKYKISQATSVMNTEGKIKAYPSTKEFVQELQKHLKIMKICDNTNLSACWTGEPEIKVYSADGKTSSVNVNTLKTGTNLKALGLGTKNTTTMSLMLADGTSMILTYSPKCTPLDSYRNYNYTFEDGKPVTNTTTNCISALFDVNGKKGPNELGTDIKTWNSIFGAVKMPKKAISKAECMSLVKKGLIKECEYEQDYWAGAVKTCNDIGMHLPSEQTLLNMGAAMFGISNIEPDTIVVFENTWGNKTCSSVITGMGYTQESIGSKQIVCLPGSNSTLSGTINSSITPMSMDTWSSKELSSTKARDIQFAGGVAILFPSDYRRSNADHDTLCVAD